MDSTLKMVDFGPYIAPDSTGRWRTIHFLFQYDSTAHSIHFSYNPHRKQGLHLFPSTCTLYGHVNTHRPYKGDKTMRPASTCNGSNIENSWKDSVTRPYRDQWICRKHTGRKRYNSDFQKSGSFHFAGIFMERAVTMCHPINGHKHHSFVIGVTLLARILKSIEVPLEMPVHWRNMPWCWSNDARHCG